MLGATFYYKCWHFKVIQLLEKPTFRVAIVLNAFYMDFKYCSINNILPQIPQDQMTVSIPADLNFYLLKWYNFWKWLIQMIILAPLDEL